MKSLLKIFGMSILAIFFLGIAVLAIHLIDVTGKKSLPTGKNLQLSRIDFTSPVDSITANHARSVIQSIHGVDYAYVNVPDGILIYSFDPLEQQPALVFEEFQRAGNFQAQLYTPSTEIAASGCPVGQDDNSLLGKMMGMFK